MYLYQNKTTVTTFLVPSPKTNVHGTHLAPKSCTLAVPKHASQTYLFGLQQGFSLSPYPIRHSHGKNPNFWLLLIFFIVLLFICAYNAWVISPPFWLLFKNYAMST
jgi:hypothetical protein